MGSFAEDVVVRHVGAGEYEASLDDGWNVVRFPQGGIVAALALRAAEDEVGGPGLVLRTCTTVFAGAVADGELVISVEVLRRGRTAAQVRSEVRNVGADSGATVVAVYGATRDGPTFTDVIAPVVPPPSQCRSFRDPPPPGVADWPYSPFWTRVEGRHALGHLRWEEYEPTGSESGTWLRFDESPYREDGTIDPLGLLVLADQMPGAIAERLGPRAANFFCPSADLTVHLFEPLRSQWVLAHSRARWADDGWASLEAMLWDEAGVPVGYATQMVLFTPL